MSAAAIDPHTFDELQANAGADFVAELVDTFAEEAPPLIAEMRSALAAGAAERFRRAAHSLKSNSSTFGATRLAAMARELELGGLPADAAGIDALGAGVRDHARGPEGPGPAMSAGASPLEPARSAGSRSSPRSGASSSTARRSRSAAAPSTCSPPWWRGATGSCRRKS